MWRVKVKFTLKSIFTYPNCDAYYHNLYYININLHYNDNVAIGLYYPVSFAALMTSRKKSEVDKQTNIKKNTISFYEKHQE